MPKKSTDFAEVTIPPYPVDTHWLIVDDIVTTGSTYVRAVNFLDIEEKPESITFACMIKRIRQTWIIPQCMAIQTRNSFMFATSGSILSISD